MAGNRPAETDPDCLEPLYAGAQIGSICTIGRSHELFLELMRRAIDGLPQKRGFTRFEIEPNGSSVAHVRRAKHLGSESNRLSHFAGANAVG